MKKKFKKTCAKVLALTMALSMAFSAAPANNADAKAKKPALSKKKVTITVKKTQKVRIKNTKGIKKTTWSVKNKKIAKLTKKKKTSVVIKGVKKGGTTVTAKVKTKKKTYKLKLKVTVKKALPIPQPTSQVTAGPDVIATPAAPDQSAQPLPGQSAAPAPGETTPPSTAPSAAPSQTPVQTETPNPDTDLTIIVPGGRSGIKQGEEIQLSATDSVTGTSLTDGITWSVNQLSGVSISSDGLLSVTKDAVAGEKITVTAATDSGSQSGNSVSFTIVENKTAELSDNKMQLNQKTDDQPLGLTYRSPEAYSIVSDPERGEVVRFDASKGYTANSYDVLAWVEVDPMYAGKTVTISAYLKYEEIPDLDTMNLVINERWGYSNPAVKWNALPDNWYYVTGTYTLPEYKDYRYDGSANRIYICRDTTNLSDGVNAVYYIDDLMITAEKAEIEKVTLSPAGDATEIYQNHTLQFSSEISGTNVPMQKVNYSIEPAVKGATISEDGVLTVGNVADGTEINIKAASYEDPTKSDTRTVTVLAQTIDTITVTAANHVAEIYQDHTLQFSAQVSSSGEPNESIMWSVEPAVEGVTISESGLLTVGNVAAGTVLTIRATSVFAPQKYEDYQVTVIANEVKNVEVSSAGDVTTIAPDSSLVLLANVAVSGSASDDVTWQIMPEVSGASLSSNGKLATLSVTSDVAADTAITIRATSVYDSAKYDEIIITVSDAGGDQNAFDLSDLSVVNDVDFSTSTTLTDYEPFFTYSLTVPEGLSESAKVLAMQGIEPTMILNAASWSMKNSGKGFSGYLGDAEKDYIQFILDNTDSETQRDFYVAFDFEVNQIEDDATGIDDIFKENSGYIHDYELPLKLIAVDENGDETVVKSGIKAPYKHSGSTGASTIYINVAASVPVPAGKEVKLQVKIDGELPGCTGTHVDESIQKVPSDQPHMVKFYMDNILVSAGENGVLEMKKGGVYQLNDMELNEGDSVIYYTGSQITKQGHFWLSANNKNDGGVCMNENCNLDNFLVADMTGDGVITATNVGETRLVALITRADGTKEKKMAVIRVTE